MLFSVGHLASAFHGSPHKNLSYKYQTYSIFENKQTSAEISCGPDLTRIDVECRPRPPSKAFPMVVNGRMHAVYIEVLDCARRQQGTSSLLT